MATWSSLSYSQSAFGLHFQLGYPVSITATWHSRWNYPDICVHLLQLVSTFQGLQLHPCKEGLIFRTRATSLTHPAPGIHAIMPHQSRSSYFADRPTVTFTVLCINPYPTAFPYGNGMVLHFYQQQDSSTTKTVHKVINKGLKTYV